MLEANKVIDEYGLASVEHLMTAFLHVLTRSILWKYNLPLAAKPWLIVASFSAGHVSLLSIEKLCDCVQDWTNCKKAIQVVLGPNSLLASTATLQFIESMFEWLFS